MNNNLDNCEHDWIEKIDSQFSNEDFVEVYCSKCGVVGDKCIATEEVYYPAT